MKYIIDMSKASADYDKFQNYSRKAIVINNTILGVAALCIAAMTLSSIWRGVTGIFNALLILLGLLVITSYVLTLFMKPYKMNVRFYKATRGGKLIGMSTLPCDAKNELVVVSIEDEAGNVRQYNIGKVCKVENTHYSEPVLNLDDARMYIPYAGTDVLPERVDAVIEAPVPQEVTPVEEPQNPPEPAPESEADNVQPHGKKNKKNKK